jgi:hypothetical protein
LILTRNILSLFDEYHTLCMLYKEFPLFQRHIPGTWFHKTLLRFEDEVMVFLKDAWVSVCAAGTAIISHIPPENDRTWRSGD